MFTGIIEAIGTVESVDDGGDVRKLAIHVPAWTEPLEAGASIAVDGACLTVISSGPGKFETELVATTLSVTIAGTYTTGREVNLERAMRWGERLDGHLVQGHVDGTGEVLESSAEGDDRILSVRVPPEAAAVTVPRGSIALNGVSLTVRSVPRPGVCVVALIPFTIEHTNLGRLEPGDSVNVEADLIGKYVGKMLAKTQEPS